MDEGEDSEEEIIEEIIARNAAVRNDREKQETEARKKRLAQRKKELSILHETELIIKRLIESEQSRKETSHPAHWQLQTQRKIR